MLRAEDHTRIFFLLFRVLSERWPTTGLTKIMAKAIMERILPAVPLLNPYTSVRNGPAQRPKNPKSAPPLITNQMAMLQKYLFLRITPRSLDTLRLPGKGVSSASRTGGSPFFSGESSTNLHIRKITAMDRTPTITTADLHPNISERMARGVVAENHPMPPTAMSIPATRASWAPRNHRPKIFMDDTKTAPRPNPTKERAATARPKYGARPNPIAPSAATRLNRTMVFFGPQESERTPTGTCTRA